MEQHLSQYQIFYVTAKCGNISRASQELFISQPAVTKAIQKLENALHTTLFKRNSRGVSLTEDGAFLYHHVREALHSLDSAEQTLERRHQLGVAHLRIGVSAIMCKYVLLPYLQRFIHLYPHVKITISCQSTYQTLKLLQEQKVDIGLISKPLSSKALVYHPVQSIQDTFVATETYLNNLLLREKEDTLYHTATFMMLDEENLSRKFINDYFKQHNIELKNIFEVSTADLLIEFAKIGMGAACVIKEFVQPELDRGELVELPLDVQFPSREIGFALLKENEELFPMQEFLELIS